MSSAHPAAGDGHPPSRRGFLAACGTAVLLAGAGGTAAGFWLKPSESSRTPVAPAALRAAVQAEQTLLATVRGARPGLTRARRAVLDELIADHEQHLSALRAAVQLAGAPAPSPSASPPSASPPSASPPSGSPPGGRPGWAGVRAAERHAAAAAASRAMRLAGTNAALLASIAACESGHVTLLELT